MYIQYMRAVIFLWFNREVLVLDARQQHASSSHAVHCDLRSARNCASSSLQPSSGDGTAHRPAFSLVQGTELVCSMFFLVDFLVFLFLFFFHTPSLLLAGGPDPKHRKKTVWPKHNREKYKYTRCTKTQSLCESMYVYCILGN